MQYINHSQITSWRGLVCYIIQARRGQSILYCGACSDNSVEVYLVRKSKYVLVYAISKFSNMYLVGVRLYIENIYSTIQ